MAVTIDWGAPRAWLQEGFIYISFPKSFRLPDSLAASWSRTGWRMPAIYRTARLLKSYYNPSFDPSIERILEEEWGFPRVNIMSYPPMWVRLYPYQREAVTYLLSSPHRGVLLNLSPGLGKTAVSIVAADALGAERILVICPKRLIPTWKREAQLWSDWRFEETRVITNYEQLLRRDFTGRWDIVIIDESVRTKNRKTKTFKALRRVTAQADKVWLLSGSPITRYRDDLWAQLHLIEPRYFRSYWRFARRYCLVGQTVWGWRVEANRPGVDIQDELRDLIFTRHQSEVLSDLPNIIWQVYDLELTSVQRKMYDQAVEEFIVELTSGERLSLPNKMARLTRLLQITSSPYNLDPQSRCLGAKIKTLVGLLHDGAIPLPALVWVHYRPGALKIIEQLEGSYRVGLAIGGARTDDLFQAFQGGKLDVLVMSLGVGKHGLTLTKAQSMVYVDRTWDADAYIQSQHRIKRIGLEHNPLAIVLRCPNTVEDLIEENLAGKLPAISELTNADLAQLLGGLA